MTFPGAPFSILAALAGLLVTSQAHALLVKDTEGREMEIEVLSYTESSGEVRIERTRDGRVFTVDIGVFAPDSQEKIAEAAPEEMPELEIDVSAGKRREDVGDSVYMERHEISLTVQVENDSLDIDLPSTTFTILAIGRNMKRYVDDRYDGAKILAKEQFTAGVTADEEFEYECDPIITEYDSDKDDTNIGGYEYDGYLLVMQNEEGEIIGFDTSIAKVESRLSEDEAHVESALGLTEGVELKRDLTR